MRLAYITVRRLLLPVLVIGYRLYIALVWTGDLTTLDTAQLLIAASSFGPAYLISTLIFCTVWKTHLFFPDRTKNDEGQPVPSYADLYATIYHSDGTKHKNCACKGSDSDVHLLSCGHVISHADLNEMRCWIDGSNRCAVCNQVAFHEGNSLFTALAKLTVGLLCCTATMLVMGMSLDPDVRLEALRLVILLPLLRHLYAVGKIRDQEGKAWWGWFRESVPFYTRFDYALLMAVPFVAVVATWSVERLYEQMVEIPEPLFSGGRTFTLLFAVVRYIFAI